MTKNENSVTDQQIVKSVCPEDICQSLDFNGLRGQWQSPGPERCGRSDWNPLSHILSKV